MEDQLGTKHRVYVEKRIDYNPYAGPVLRDINNVLGIDSVRNVRVLTRYDIYGLENKDFLEAVEKILSEPPVDNVFFDKIDKGEKDTCFAVEYLPGQYEQRGDSAAQCIQILTLKKRPVVKTATIYILSGDIKNEETENIKKYLINPVDSREALHDAEETRDMGKPEIKVETVLGFTRFNRSEMENLRRSEGISISIDDLMFCSKYFREEEKRDPTRVEIRILDTYWSDHCRHTTFETVLENVKIEDGFFSGPLKKIYGEFKKQFAILYGSTPGKKETLMSIATMSMKELLSKGKLEDLEISDEINACSIKRDIHTSEGMEEWLIMFKNETHNHPTEIEPFGGAATCLGGAIRDPLSGRAYVHQSMRVTGSGDPTVALDKTIKGKLPQRKITLDAARGFSSYGNQIGLATGEVSEIYHPGYMAKRMEVGAVIGAVKKEYVRREKPSPGDRIILVGGRTGRDGIGGATGSSKEHDESSVETAGAEVQKGNAPEERKLQRLFRNGDVIKLIKKSNDFGAGGVSVAVGELADGVRIDLDKILKKYEGLNGLELALSESQERMAVVVEEKDAEKFMIFSAEENLEATVIAEVTDNRRLEIYWKGLKLADISRDFLDTSGVRQTTGVMVKYPDKDNNYFKNHNALSMENPSEIEQLWIKNLDDLNNVSQKGLKEMFDGTVGAGTVLMPLGGRYGETPVEAMASLVPVLDTDTTTVTLMSYGFNPFISEWSPFHGGVYSVVEAVTKIITSGGDYSGIRLSLQEYFEKLGKDPGKWGKPFAALLGAYSAMKEFGIAAIGGKDSMSGTFLDLNVPPTLIAFAVNTTEAELVTSPEFKKPGNTVALFYCPRDDSGLPDFKILKSNFEQVMKGIKDGYVISAKSVCNGGIADSITKMCLGNRIGFKFEKDFDPAHLFTPDYGTMIVEIDNSPKSEKFILENNFKKLGKTTDIPIIRLGKVELDIESLSFEREKKLSEIFPVKFRTDNKDYSIPFYEKRGPLKSRVRVALPGVVIPVFPGTNCEYDLGRVFENEGAVVSTPVFNNLTPAAITASIENLKNEIERSQILAIPGGFSAGDEPDGSGKFIATVFRNPYLTEAVTDLIKKRDGLIIGICNGFQALVKLGLLPYGEILPLTKNSPTLTFNRIERHISKIVDTKIISVLSPWYSFSRPGDIHTVPISHGEGRFIASEELIEKMITGGQISTQYVDSSGVARNDPKTNPNGSDYCIEGITSPDGRILGKMGHSERVGKYLYKNVPGNYDLSIFRAGVEYFK